MSAEAVLTRGKQAVVIIHGIGEQRPMGTLRDFVDAVLGNKSDPPYFSKPDPFADTFELRRLTTPASPVSPATHFYELYWAHLMPVGSWWGIFNWLKAISRHKVKDILPQMPKLIRPLLAVLAILLRFSRRLLFLFAIVLTFTLAYYYFNDKSAIVGIVTKYFDFDDKVLGVIIAITLATWGILLYNTRATVGDVATYLDSSPRNVETRHIIRSAGVAFLNKLHDSNEYDRIVIVGHSLGSVIGYDIITHAWQRYNRDHFDDDAPVQRQMKEAEILALRLQQTTSSPEKDCEDWRNQSLSLWAEQRRLGCPWLVTDFITLGSPLTYGALLLADRDHPFDKRKDQRELPACPPAMEEDKDGGKTFSYEIQYSSPLGGTRSVRVPHHAACFALTRWTNLYFPTNWWLKGDIIGGPLRGLFGNGIRDIPLKACAPRTWFLHTTYWKLDPGADTRPDGPVWALREALDLRREGFRSGAFVRKIRAQIACDFEEG